MHGATLFLRVNLDFRELERGSPGASSSKEASHRRSAILVRGWIRSEVLARLDLKPATQTDLRPKKLAFDPTDRRQAARLRITRVSRPSAAALGIIGRPEWLESAISVGGEGWIRTSVRLRGQIYSLLPLTTRPPLHEVGQARHVAALPVCVNAPKRLPPRSAIRLACAPTLRHAPGMPELERVKGIEPSS